MAAGSAAAHGLAGPHLVDDFSSLIEEAGLGDLAQEVGIQLPNEGDGLGSSSQLPLQVHFAGQLRASAATPARRNHW